MKDTNENKSRMESQRGITLVALVVTIIVIIILASISIKSVFSEKGIMQQAKDEKKAVEDRLKREEENLKSLLGEYKNSMNGSGSTDENDVDKDDDSNTNSNSEVPSTPTVTPTPVPTGPKGTQLVSSVTDTNHETIIGEDELGNKVAIPAGFKFIGNSEAYVEDGIVVEDELGNQFVWVPVSNINKDGSNKILLCNGDEVEVPLRRTYSSGAYTNKEQLGVNYNSIVAFAGKYQERVADSPLLGEFVESTVKFGGFFIARYKLAQESGLYVSKPRMEPLNTSQGTIRSGARSMYSSSNVVHSDLTFSYAYCTFASFCTDAKIPLGSVPDNDIPSPLTGYGSMQCNVFEFGKQWSTEYSTYTESGSSYSLVILTSANTRNHVRYGSCEGRACMWIIP